MVVPARISYEKTLTKLTVLQSIVGILCLQKEWVQKALKNVRFFVQCAYFKSPEDNVDICLSRNFIYTLSV